MATKIKQHLKTMGTLPVFMTAISTILGAVLFLQFGKAIANVGLMGTFAIIILGHLVTIPTAMAVAEIATNQKVEGGGAYYIISRSFGLNIGGSIGIALFLSQAISIAFYVIAFTEAFEPLRQWVIHEKGWEISRLTITLSTMTLLSALILTKGANVGIKALYLVVAIIFLSLFMFFMGNPGYSADSSTIFSRITTVLINGQPTEPMEFFKVFAIIFPAFTGIAAGLGLSGDLKDPKLSIPRGTLWATVLGVIIYLGVALKLFYSAPSEELASDPLVMSKIAIWGPIIPIGLASAAISSALGSILVAPRTLQAIGNDKIFPGTLNKWVAKGKAKNNEPFNASLITIAIAFLFVLFNDIDIVGEIISMFFMLTYGAINMVSFLEHFAADPSYRPTFKSHWSISLLGGLLSFFFMIKMNAVYAWLSVLMMVGIYVWITRSNKNKQMMTKVFQGVIFQASRWMQIFLQKRDDEALESHWRPFLLCITSSSFERNSVFDMTRWVSHTYGFGTYMHYIEGYLNQDNYKRSEDVKRRLLKQAEGFSNRVYIDTIISPSFTSALAQAIQLPGISGKGNNMILFDYVKQDEQELQNILSNYAILKAKQLDVCILRSSIKGFGFKKEIHLWLTTSDYRNATLIVLLGYILLGHPDWKEAHIKVFSIYNSKRLKHKQERIQDMIKSGRLPISPQNIELIENLNDRPFNDIINEKSCEADLAIIGFTDKDIEDQNASTFETFDKLGTVLFVNASDTKDIN
jgi:amino acid transporter